MYICMHMRMHAYMGTCTDTHVYMHMYAQKEKERERLIKSKLLCLNKIDDHMFIVLSTNLWSNCLYNSCMTCVLWFAASYQSFLKKSEIHCWQNWNIHSKWMMAGLTPTLKPVVLVLVFLSPVGTTTERRPQGRGCPGYGCSFTERNMIR